MNFLTKPFLGIPRVFFVLVIVIVAPILGGLAYVHEDLLMRQSALERACIAVLSVTPTPMDTPTPTASPSPTLKPVRYILPAPTGGVVK